MPRFGIDVPGNIVIAGFAAYEISDICVPPITSVDTHCDRLGTLSAQRMIDLRSDENDETTTSQTVLEPELLKRASRI